MVMTEGLDVKYFISIFYLLSFSYETATTVSYVFDFEFYISDAWGHLFLLDLIIWP